MSQTFIILGVSISNGGLPKHPQAGAVQLNAEGVAGDAHTHPQHGGPDKAVSVFAERDYQAIEDAGFKPSGDTEWDVGAMGENLTIDFGNYDPLDLCIGDTLFNDNVVLQISEPRRPCFNLDVYGAQLQELMRAEMRAGFLLRVHKPGLVQASDTLTRIYSYGMSLRRCNWLYHQAIRQGTPEERAVHLETLLREPSLSESFKAQARKKAL